MRAHHQDRRAQAPWWDDEEGLSQDLWDAEGVLSWDLWSGAGSSDEVADRLLDLGCGPDLPTIAAIALEAVGCPVPEEAVARPELWPLLVEAANWAAKVTPLEDEGAPVQGDFYALKGALLDFTAEYLDGGHSGSTYSLYSEEVGVVCFHGRLPDDARIWPHPWSGVHRQHLSWRALRDAGFRGRLAKLTDPHRARVRPVP